MPIQTEKYYTLRVYYFYIEYLLVIPISIMNLEVDNFNLE